MVTLEIDIDLGITAKTFKETIRTTSKRSGTFNEYFNTQQAKSSISTHKKTNYLQIPKILNHSERLPIFILVHFQNKISCENDAKLFIN